MTNARNTKKALLMSALSLVLCISMLVGTTFAWFTDSVTSANNIIASGNLDVEMYWAKGTEDPANATWIDASTGAIFNYDKWEPGYAEVRHIKIANEGSLALKYRVDIIANGTVSELADVIDVYYVDPAVQVADRTALTDANKIGTLTEVLAALGETGNGTLAAGAIDTITIALKMQEGAGNEYQNKSIGTDFAIQLLATQYTAEDDSFDDQYDADAAWTWTGAVDTSWYDATATSFTLDAPEMLAGLSALVNAGNTFAGKTITLDANVNLNNIEWTPIGTANSPFEGTFNGNGHTIYNLKMEAFDEGSTKRYVAMFEYVAGTAVFENIKFDNVNVDASRSATLLGYVDTDSLVVRNIEIVSGTIKSVKAAAGIVFSAESLPNVEITNCINRATVISPQQSGGIAAGASGIMTNCANYGAILGGYNATGGLVGSFSNGTITACVNEGVVSMNPASQASWTNTCAAGGIVGVASGVTLVNCVNKADVTTIGSDVNATAGGIVGRIPGGVNRIENCVNDGNITAENYVAAGIANSLYGSVTAIECVNNGNVSGATGATGTVAAAGTFSGTNTVTDCVNNGLVTVG